MTAKRKHHHQINQIYNYTPLQEPDINTQSNK